MNYWLLIADPMAYSFDDLEKDKRAVWDGIAAALAQKHLRAVRKGDAALIYHTAPDKAVVGTARIISDPYPDPADAEGERVVVDVTPLQRLARPVPLAQLKQNNKLAGMVFLRIQRVAVSPVSESELKEIAGMGR